eukprot:CAMPEP_0173306414 /NCGR_PEP_ID=MMETSP1143-20121109/20559_1 /TAXON_ID=483371 /ORGANISM="non described non described, Strain CCMP2298" /LENGTH=58 /DNA_ID=CAMNT_0014247487 /DNA_START=342 /DNA_END=514 /DNA_ORIENTATION=-
MSPSAAIVKVRRGTEAERQRLLLGRAQVAAATGPVRRAARDRDGWILADRKRGGGGAA